MGLFSRLQNSESAAAKATSAAQSMSIGADAILELVDKFPPGDVDIATDFDDATSVHRTILLGYQIDTRRIYVGKMIRPNDDGLEIEVAGEVHDTAGANKMFMLVALIDAPANGGDSAQLFGRGCEVELRSYRPNLRPAQVDGVIRKRVALTRGPYQGQQVMLVEPTSTSLHELELRSQPRIDSDIEVSLRLDPAGAHEVRAVLADFSGSNHRLVVRDEPEALSQLGPDTALRYTLHLAEGDEREVSATVTKIGSGFIVVRIDNLVVNGTAQPLTPVTALGLKTALMQATG